LIIDDGSTDNTQDLIDLWLREAKIPIRFYRTNNGGKQKAHNFAVTVAESELFICLDSDDILAENAIEFIKFEWKKKQGDVAGIVAYKCNLDTGELLSTEFPKIGLTKLGDIYRLGFVGETALVYRVDILQKCLYPNIPGEFYMPDSYVYENIDRDYDLIVLPKILEICRYMSDGTSVNMYKTHKNNPIGYAKYYNQKSMLANSYLERYFSIIHYIAFSLLAGTERVCRNSHFQIITALLFPAGLLLFLSKKIDYWRYLK
jgi:glycosyltransferase involved in cell wall biosynthesis